MSSIIIICTLFHCLKIIINSGLAKCSRNANCVFFYSARNYCCSMKRSKDATACHIHKNKSVVKPVSWLHNIDANNNIEDYQKHNEAASTQPTKRTLGGCICKEKPLILMLKLYCVFPIIYCCLFYSKPHNGEHK